MNLLESQELQIRWCNFDRLAPECIFSKVNEFCMICIFLRADVTLLIAIQSLVFSGQIDRTKMLGK